MMDETRQLLSKVLNDECWSLRDDFRLYQLMETLSTELNQNVIAADNSLRKIVLDLFLGKVSLCTAANKIFGLQTRQFVESGILEDYCSVLCDEATFPMHNNKSEVPYKPEHILAETVASGIEVLEKIAQQNERLAIDPYDNYLLPKIVGSKEWTECTHTKMTVPDMEHRRNSETNSLLDLPVLPQCTEILDAFVAPEETLHRKPLPKVVSNHVEPTKHNLIITSNKHMQHSAAISTDPGTYYGDQSKTNSIFFSDAIFTADETPSAKVDVTKRNPPALNKAEVEVNNSSQISDHDHDPFMTEIQGNSSLPSGLFANIAKEIEKHSFTRNSLVSKAREEEQSQEKLGNTKHDGHEIKFEETDHPSVPSVLPPRAESSKKDPLFTLFFDEPPPDDFDIIFKNPKTNESEIEESHERSVKPIHNEFIDDHNLTPKQNEHVPHLNKTQRDQSLTDQWFYDTNDFANPLDSNANKRSDNLFGFPDLSDSMNSVESEQKCSPPPLPQITKNHKLTLQNLIENQAKTSRQVSQISKQNERESKIYPSSVRASHDNDLDIDPLNQNKTIISVSGTEILPNLTKDRPKIQAYRRPPTRQGRKRSYLRSLEEVDSHNEPGESLSKTLTAGVKDEDLFAICPPNLEQSGSTRQTKKVSYGGEELYSSSPSNDDWLLQNTKGASSDISELKANHSESNSLSKAKKPVSLFFDDPESDEFLFNAIQKPSSVQPISLTRSSKSNLTQSLFNSDDEDDLFLG